MKVAADITAVNVQAAVITTVSDLPAVHTLAAVHVAAATTVNWNN